MAQLEDHVTAAMRALQVGWRSRGTSALQRLGYEVDILADAEAWDWYALSNWRGHAGSVVFVENYNDSEHLAFRLRRLMLAGARYDAVVGFDEFSLIPCWQAANILKIPALDWNVIVNMRDKSAQKAALRNGGIPCAQWWLVDDIRGERDKVLSLSRHLPLVVKPYSGAATMHTFVARSASQLHEVVDRLAMSPRRTVMVETYIAGTEHHADGVVRDGEVCVFSLGEYLDNLIRITEGATPASVGVSPVRSAQLYHDARDLISRALSRLGLRNGVFHVELFRTADSWVLSEAAMRVGGGGISLHHEAVGGVDLHEAMARVQIGLPPQGGHGVAETTSTVSGWTSLPGSSGIVRSFPHRGEILGRDGVVDVEFDIHPGQRLGSGTTDTMARVGSAVLFAPTREEFIDRRQSLIKWFRERVVVDSAT